MQTARASRESIRYTHRVAISNSRLIAHDDRGVTFRWKDYRVRGPHPPQDHDPRRGGVHAALPPARAAARLPSYPPLWLARECPSRPRARYRTHTATRRTASAAGRPQKLHGRPQLPRPTSLPLSSLRRTDDRRLRAAAAAAHPRTACLAMLLNTLQHRPPQSAPAPCTPECRPVVLIATLNPSRLSQSPCATTTTSLQSTRSRRHRAFTATSAPSRRFKPL